MQTSSYCANSRSRSSRKNTRLQVDMTPMVDLGFLLITFFILNAEMSRSSISDLYMTKDGPPTLLGEKDAYTVILMEHQGIISYQGNFNQARLTGGIKKISLTALRTNISSIQQQNPDRKQLMLLIKPTKNASYGAVIRMLDEVLINDIKKYALVDLSDEELSYLATIDTASPQ